MVGMHGPAIAETAGTEIMVTMRKVAQECSPQGGHVPGSCSVRGVGETRSIAKGRVPHPERACLSRHTSGKTGLVAGQRFCDHCSDIVGRLGDQCANRIVNSNSLARSKPQGSRRLACGMRRCPHGGSQLYFSPVQRFEKEIEGHHLRERCRISTNVRVPRLQGTAAGGIDHQQRGLRGPRGVGPQASRQRRYGGKNPRVAWRIRRVISTVTHDIRTCGKGRAPAPDHVFRSKRDAQWSLTVANSPDTQPRGRQNVRLHASLTV